ncbi:MAG TPA: type II toxin-antitoxin system RelE/ParE family toxin [Pseudomonadota bacterium]|nr:type II toxin-antitoxin system RelE/ParE family toxin [Pseudomonadota bacterium]
MFFRLSDAEPVRDWLLSLPKEERKIVGADIKTVEFGWPIGMPTCRPMGQGLFEVRSNLPNRIARVLFCIEDGHMVLLHAFIKKDRQTPETDLRIARERMKRSVRFGPFPIETNLRQSRP